MKSSEMLKLAGFVNPRDMVDFSAFHTPEFAQPLKHSIGTQAKNLAMKPFRVGAQFGQAAWSGHNGGPSVVDNLITHGVRGLGHAARGEWGAFNPGNIGHAVGQSFSQPFQRAVPQLNDEIGRGNELWSTIGKTLRAPYDSLKLLNDPSKHYGY
jgi:hypothetical protein